MDIDIAAAQLSALGSPTRLRLYRLLVRAGDTGLSMGQIQEKLGVPGSTLTHHCRALIQVDLLKQEKVGTSLICRTNFVVMRQLLDDLAAECCADMGIARGVG